ncbi:hypothetical protein OSTOST_15917, partial [Ostertagia ostertagi]
MLQFRGTQTLYIELYDAAVISKLPICADGQSVYIQIKGHQIDQAAETIGEIRFDTIFSLARLISIYESERNDDSRRFLMTDSKFPFITATGSQKAFTFYKHCCDHVFRSLALHDGSLLSLPHDGGTGFPINQLNDLNNEGVKFAKMNSWKEIVAETQRQHTTLLLLPDGFRHVNSAFKPQHNVERKVYYKFYEVSRFLETSSSNTCIVVGPTLDVTPPKKEWCRFASALAAAARNGNQSYRPGATTWRRGLRPE